MDVYWMWLGCVQLTATGSPAGVQPAASQCSAHVQPSIYTRPASFQPTSRPRQKCWTFNGPYCRSYLPLAYNVAQVFHSGFAELAFHQVNGQFCLSHYLKETFNLTDVILPIIAIDDHIIYISFASINISD